jgi:hypothetical protein
MDKIDIILLTVGRIEGELIEIRKLNARVSHLERWQAWLKGGWAAVVAMYVHLCRVLTQHQFWIALVVPFCSRCR